MWRPSGELAAVAGMIVLAIGVAIITKDPPMIEMALSGIRDATEQDTGAPRPSRRKRRAWGPLRRLDSWFRRGEQGDDEVEAVQRSA